VEKMLKMLHSLMEKKTLQLFHHYSKVFQKTKRLTTLKLETTQSIFQRIQLTKHLVVTQNLAKTHSIMMKQFSQRMHQMDFHLIQ
jgi:hypothetical protein